MSDVKKLISKYVIKHERKIKEICRPLIDHLNIPIFTYHSLDKAGTLVTLTSYPEQIDYYYSEKLFLSNPYFTHPDLLRSGCILTRSTPDKEYLKTVECSRQLFQVNNPFLILKKNEDQTEGFFFGTNSPKNCVNYFEIQELLNKFVHYFRQEAAPYIERMRAEKYSIIQDKGKSFFERDPNLPLSNHNPNFQQFIKSISPLSNREMQCLDLFIEGKSAQTTAAILGISRRTVEHYFESIKNKLGLQSKWDLLRFK